MRYVSLAPSLYMQQRSLASLGSSEVAWPINAALEVLTELERLHCPILGGDVYLVQEDGLDFSDENWFTDRFSGESEQAYFQRSHQETRAFLTRLSKRSEPYLVTLVLSEGIEFVTQ